MASRNYVKRGIKYFKRNGLLKTAAKAVERLERDREEQDYVPDLPDDETLAAQRDHKFENPYRFSVLVPVYETDPVLFRQMLDSVGEQTYTNWELILADASADESLRSVVREFMEEYSLICRDSFGTINDKVKYVRVENNGGISANTNVALSHATGDYVALLDHDDLLEKTALFDIMSAIETAETGSRESDSIARIMAVFTDEDKISEDSRTYFDPNRKPGFDPVLLCTNNYICHLFVADTNLAKSVGGFRSEYDGAQDHDFILRCTEGIRREQILHVPKVLYHWRSTKGSTSENPDAKLYAYEAGQRAVADYLKRAGIDAKVSNSEHLGFFRIEYAKLHRSVTSLTHETFCEMEKMNVTMPRQEFVMILGSELSPLDPTYIEDMMSCMNFPNTGAVTGKIIASCAKIESAGYDVLEDGTVKARFEGLSRFFSGYMHRADLDQTVGAFPPDCVLVRTDAVKEWYPAIKLREGYDIYYTPKAVFKRTAK